MSEENNKTKNVLKETKKKSGALWNDFKKFITKGNVIDMAVGVIVGAAFSAIVTAIINGILMPLITSAIPTGGINGLVTVLNHSQAYVCEASNTAAIQKAVEDGKTLVYYWNHAYDSAIVTVINWGTVVNAIIYFLAVALILFAILKTVQAMKAHGAKIQAKLQEQYYKKHPEERPVPAPEEPKKPTEAELLQQILDEIKQSKSSK